MSVTPIAGLIMLPLFTLFLGVKSWPQLAACSNHKTSMTRILSFSFSTELKWYIIYCNSQIILIAKLCLWSRLLKYQFENNPPTRFGVHSLLFLCSIQNFVTTCQSKIPSPKSKIQDPQNPKSKIPKIQNPQIPKSKLCT